MPEKQLCSTTGNLPAQNILQNLTGWALTDSALNITLEADNITRCRHEGASLKTEADKIELELIRGCQKGKSRAQEKLYKRFYGYGMSIALRYSRDMEESKEILNESFLKVFNKIETFEEGKSFKAWLRRIVINTSIDYYRANKKHLYDVEISEAAGVDDNDDVIDRLTAEEIMQLLQQLPDQQRLIFNLYEVEGYSHREISEQLNIPEGTCRSALTRARQKLKQMVVELYKKDYEGSV